MGKDRGGRLRRDRPGGLRREGVTVDCGESCLGQCESVMKTEGHLPGLQEQSTKAGRRAAWNLLCDAVKRGLPFNS